LDVDPCDSVSLAMKYNLIYLKITSRLTLYHSRCNINAGLSLIKESGWI
jgi:hypothetical protein